MGTITKSDRRWIKRIVSTLGPLVEPGLQTGNQSFRQIRLVPQGDTIPPLYERVPDTPEGFATIRSYPADFVRVVVGRHCAKREISAAIPAPPPPTDLSEFLERWLECKHVADDWEERWQDHWKRKTGPAGVYYTVTHEFRWNGLRLDGRSWGVMADWYEDRGRQEIVQWIRREARGAAGEEGVAAKPE